jgi:sugar lactone lactonase YvrE
VTVRSLGSAEPILRARATLAEGPRWDGAAQRLLWVDIEEGELHVFDPAAGEDRVLQLGAKVGAAAPARSGHVLVALADRLARVSLDDGAAETLVEVPHDHPDMRMNDGACDPAGRFWVGSMPLDERRPLGAVYRYEAGKPLERVFEGVTVSNGIGWSPDHTLMYYADSATRRIDLFDHDPDSGAISSRRPFAVLADGDGFPDGLAVDDEGGVWLAVWGGGHVRRYRADGTLDGTLSIPAQNVTACCFGPGTQLYVTTASRGLQPGEQPLAGSIFVADVGMSGPPAQPFAD